MNAIYTASQLNVQIYCTCLEDVYINVFVLIFYCLHFNVLFTGTYIMDEPYKPNHKQNSCDCIYSVNICLLFMKAVWYVATFRYSQCFESFPTQKNLPVRAV